MKFFYATALALLLASTARAATLNVQVSNCSGQGMAGTVVSLYDGQTLLKTAACDVGGDAGLIDPITTPGVYRLSIQNGAVTHEFDLSVAVGVGGYTITNMVQIGASPLVCGYGATQQTATAQLWGDPVDDDQ